MPNEAHYRKLERMYLSAPCNAYYKPRAEIRDRECTIRIPIVPNLHHAAGAAHGSVYFKAADDAAFFAVNSLIDDVFVLTTHLNLYLVRPIQEGEIIAHGRVTYASRNLWHAESTLTNSDGKEVGRATASFVKSKIALTPEIGYK